MDKLHFRDMADSRVIVHEQRRYDSKILINIWTGLCAWEVMKAISNCLLHLLKRKQKEGGKKTFFYKSKEFYIRSKFLKRSLR